MPVGEVIVPIKLSTLSLKDPVLACKALCKNGKYHYFALQGNATCKCIANVPLGGNLCFCFLMLTYETNTLIGCNSTYFFFSKLVLLPVLIRCIEFVSSSYFTY